MATASGRRREAPDVRREQILDAAEAVLLERGLAATTMADVASAAGIAKGTSYLYFPSKADVLAELRSRYLERFAHALTNAPARSTKTAAARLEHFIRAFFDFSVAHAELHHLLFQEAGFSEDDAFASMRALLAQLVSDGMADGEFHTNDAGLATDFLLHGLHGALLHTLHQGPPDRRRFNARATELARRVLDVEA